MMFFFWYIVTLSLVLQAAQRVQCSCSDQCFLSGLYKGKSNYDFHMKLVKKWKQYSKTCVMFII